MTPTETLSKTAFRPEAELSGTLPSYLYWDPEIYECEKEAIWFRTWQFVGHVSDLASPGDYFTAEILDQKVFVVHGKDGRVRAFYLSYPVNTHDRYM